MTKIHQSAVVDKAAQLGEDVEVGPFCVVGPDVKLGAGTRLMSHVVLDGWTTLGSECVIFPFASIGTRPQDLSYRGEKTFVRIGDRTTVRESATINRSTKEGGTTRVGSDSLIMAYSHIAHECQVGDRVVIANCGTLAGHVTVENDAIIGGLAAVHQFAKIGAMCMIGGCSRIQQDCLPYMIVAGTPAKVSGPNSIGLKRKGLSPTVRRSLKKAFKLLCRSGLSTNAAIEGILSELEPCAELDHLIQFVKNSERGFIR